MCGGWPKCNTLLSCTRYFTSIKGFSSNSRWAWRCNGRQWMGSQRLKMVLQGGASTSSYATKLLLCKHLEQTLPSNANWEIKMSSFSSWGAHATRPWLYECSYFEQPTCKPKMKCERNLWSNEKESEIKTGWTWPKCNKSQCQNMAFTSKWLKN